MSDKKLSKQQLHVQGEIAESKALTLDDLFIKEGQIKMSIKQLNEQKEYNDQHHRDAFNLLQKKLLKTRRLVKYKRMALQK